jgi:DNA anti-recombination protein RmuC
VVNEPTSLRSEMTQRAEKTAEGIAELNKQTAVLSTQLTTINSELVKIGEQLRQQQTQVRNLLEFAAALLTIMAVLVIGAWIQNWWDWRKENRK